MAQNKFYRDNKETPSRMKRNRKRNYIKKES